MKKRYREVQIVNFPIDETTSFTFLEQLIEQRTRPAKVICDNAPKFITKALFSGARKTR